MNTCVQVYGHMHSFVLDKCPRVEWLDPRCMLNFLRKCQSFLRWLCHLHSYWQCMRNLVSLYLANLQLDVKSLISWNIVSYGDGLTLKKFFPHVIELMKWGHCLIEHPHFCLCFLSRYDGGFVFALPGPVNWKAAPKTKMDSDLTFFLARISSRGASLVQGGTRGASKRLQWRHQLYKNSWPHTNNWKRNLIGYFCSWLRAPTLQLITLNVPKYRERPKHLSCLPIRTIF